MIVARGRRPTNMDQTSDIARQCNGGKSGMFHQCEVTLLNLTAEFQTLYQIDGYSRSRIMKRISSYRATQETSYNLPSPQGIYISLIVRRYS
jgi:hypothetical protein